MKEKVTFTSSPLGKKMLRIILIAGLSILALSFFIPRKAAFDVNMFDTYHILSKRTFYHATGLYLLLCCLVYRINGRTPFLNRLAVAHLLLTLVPVIYVLGRIGGFNSEEAFITPAADNKVFFLLTIVFIAGQALLLLNLVIGAIRLSGRKS
ncbi:hypothetical protein [Pedobacter sp. SYP-B3415]|uniref:hypothetical protein n=1 Tax=Pedobacter sp. SYP-B3415 TaxID=2496641 RepID=UPI00101CA7D1|nr:hypothetical protein [Pedobacter sp. SYP-B3415]